MDPTLVHDLDADAAFRDALEGAGAPATWIVPKQQADQEKKISRQQMAQQQQIEQGAHLADTGANLAAKIGNAATLLKQGGITPPTPVQPGGAM